MRYDEAPTNIATKPLLTVREAAQLLSLSMDVVYRRCASGDLPTLKVGRTVRVRNPLLVVEEPVAEAVEA
jgi:excisionase family DNA binding protein